MRAQRFQRLLNGLALEDGNDRFRELRGAANILHANFYDTQAEPERRDYPQGPGQRG